MTPTTPIPSTAEGMISKTEISNALTTAGFSQDIATGIQNWLIEQPGDSVPQEAFMLQLAEMAEIENHMATTMGDLADEVGSFGAENQRIDDQAGIAELKIQRDALAQIQQSATTAEQIAVAAGAQTAVTSTSSVTPSETPVAAQSSATTQPTPDAAA